MSIYKRLRSFERELDGKELLEVTQTLLTIARKKYGCSIIPRACLPRCNALAGIVLSACSSKPEPVLVVKTDDAAAVVQKMPASVSDREAWAQAIAKTFESQRLASTEENVCSVLAVAQQESNYQADPAVPGLSKIAWQEIDRRAEKMHIPVFLVHTALKINSPNGKSYSERLDNVKTEKQLSAIFDDFIGMVPMGQKLFGSLNPVHGHGSGCRSVLPSPSSIPTAIHVKNGRHRASGRVQPARR